MPVARFQMPDGKIGRFEVPEGTTPEAAQSMIEQHLSPTSADNLQSAFEAKKAGYLQTIGDQAAQGGTFGLFDEGRDALKALGNTLQTGVPISQAYAAARSESQPQLQAELDQHPVVSVLANLGGGLATGGLGASNLLRGGNLAERLFKSTLAGAAGGGLYGAGSAQDGHRMAGLESGAVIGGVGGLALPVAGAAINGAKIVKNGLTDIINPANKRNIGRVLASQMDNPEAVLGRLAQTVQEYVPGSRPTLAEIAGDNGLIAAQQAFENNNPGALASVRQANTAARGGYLADIAQTPQDIERAKLQRGATTSPLYEKASMQPVDLQAMQTSISDIDEALAKVGAHTDAGKTLIRLKGSLTDSLQEGAVNGPLSQVYKEIRDEVTKTAMQPGSYSAAVRGVIKPVVHKLGQAIEGQNSDIAQANAKFRELSQPINQMEVLQDIQERALKNQPIDVQGNQAIRPNVINSALTNEGRKELSEVLNADQMSVLENLQKDLQRQSVMRSVRPDGSPTSSNLKASEITKEVLNKIVTSKLDKIPVIGAALKDRNEKALQKALADIYANPKKALGPLKLQQAFEAKKIKGK